MDLPLQQDLRDTLPLDQLPKGPNTRVSRTHERKDDPWPLRQYLREMFEVTLGLGSAVIAGVLIPRNWAAPELIFCAFFLVVFAIAIRYRAATAYSGSVLAAVSYSLLLWRRPALYAPFDVRYMLMEAFLLLCSGVLMNALLRAQRQRFTAAERQQAQKDALLQEQTRTYQKALMLNAELERQITGQTTTVTTISDKLAQFWKREGDARYSAILDVVVHVLEAQSCAVYVQRRGEMHCCACQPEGAYASAPTLNPDDPVIGSALRLRQVRTIRDVLALDPAVSQKAAVMAGPLLDQDGHVVGMVIVDTLPLLKFTPGAVRLFSSLLQLASLALQPTLPGGETDHEAHPCLLSLSPTQHMRAAGPHTPLPTIEIGEDACRSLLSVYPTEHSRAVVQDTRTGDANHAR